MVSNFRKARESLGVLRHDRDLIERKSVFTMWLRPPGPVVIITFQLIG